MRSLESSRLSKADCSDLQRSGSDRRAAARDHQPHRDTWNLDSATSGNPRLGSVSANGRERRCLRSQKDVSAELTGYGGGGLPLGGG
jgi:hypothetical protein